MHEDRGTVAWRPPFLFDNITLTNLSCLFAASHSSLCNNAGRSTDNSVPSYRSFALAVFLPSASVCAAPAYASYLSSSSTGQRAFSFILPHGDQLLGSLAKAFGDCLPGSWQCNANNDAVDICTPEGRWSLQEYCGKRYALMWLSFCRCSLLVVTQDVVCK